MTNAPYEWENKQVVWFVGHIDFVCLDANGERPFLSFERFRRGYTQNGRSAGAQNLEHLESR